MYSLSLLFVFLIIYWFMILVIASMTALKNADIG